MTGVIIQILIAKHSGETLRAIDAATLVAGKGIVGDRYYSGGGTFSDKFEGSAALEVSLIEQEEIDQFEGENKLGYTAVDFRRNIVTAGIRLNDLVDKEFQIGSVTLKGIKLCEPCGYLADKLGDIVLTKMLHKAGLRAQIIVGGDIHTHDIIGEK